MSETVSEGQSDVPNDALNDVIIADVVIVGAGMTGLALACALGGRGLQILVIDGRDPEAKTPGADESRTDPFEFNSGVSPRVSSINLASEQFLDSIGVWQHLDIRRSGCFAKMTVWDGEGTAVAEFDAHSIQYDHLGHIVENEQIVQALISQLNASGDITLLTPANMVSFTEKEAGLQLLIDGDRLVKCELIIGADGSNSSVRQQSDIPTRQWSYQQHALVTTLRTQNPHQATAWQNFTRHGPLAFLPLADEHLCSIVWSVSPEYCDQLLQMDAETFCRHVGACFENRLGLIECVDKRYSFALQQRHGKRYVSNGVALIGDAAHTIHPLAGQGVNLGFKDVDVLSQELTRALNRKIGLGSREVLERYERRRMGSNLAMMAGMEGFVQLYGRQTPGVNWLRNLGMKFFNDSTVLKNVAARVASGI
jgi:2-octaprenylphenol hydroxylase